MRPGESDVKNSSAGRSERAAEARPRAARRLPAEWERHRATWFAWPHNEETWPGVFEAIPEVFARLIRLIRRFEEVRLLVADEATMEGVSRRQDLGTGFPLTLVQVATNDAWVRDFGPLFVHGQGRELTASVWRFNAWGGKYPPWDFDAAAGRQIAR